MDGETAKTNINTIARVAKVSTSTVSNFINGTEVFPFSPETRRYRGTVSLTTDTPSRFYAEDWGFALEIPAREFTVYLKFDDEEAAEFDELLGSTRRAWESYRQESYIRIPSVPIRRMYETSQYHLPGIYDSH